MEEEEEEEDRRRTSYVSHFWTERRAVIQSSISFRLSAHSKSFRKGVITWGTETDREREREIERVRDGEQKWKEQVV